MDAYVAFLIAVGVGRSSARLRATKPTDEAFVEAAGKRYSVPGQVDSDRGCVINAVARSLLLTELERLELLAFAIDYNLKYFPNETLPHTEFDQPTLGRAAQMLGAATTASGESLLNVLFLSRVQTVAEVRQALKEKPDLHGYQVAVLCRHMHAVAVNVKTGETHNPCLNGAQPHLPPSDLRYPLCAIFVRRYVARTFKRRKQS